MCVGHVTGRFLSQQLELYLPSVFNILDCGNSMSCFVPDSEFADVSNTESLWDLFDVNVQAYSFCPLEKYKHLIGHEYGQNCVEQKMFGLRLASKYSY